MSAQVRAIASRVVCAGCGALVAHDPLSGAGAFPFRCPQARANDDIDHVLTRELDAGSLWFPEGEEPNPFVKYRTLFHSYHVATAAGMPDADYVALVRALGASVAQADGRCGFLTTPFGRHDSLSDRLGLVAAGGVWVKNETGNVSGSHKARHLMGIMIYLRVLDALGDTGVGQRRLAIASCGNAALAAAVVARAAGRALDVFIPPDAPQSVVARLGALGACAVVCPREPGAAGDPCYRRFQQAVRDGSIPFCCQGNANGLTIEGGETLGYEMIAALGTTTLDAIVIQVGGGALASALIQAFSDAQALGRCRRLPRVYTVQTRGAFPLKRAYDRLLAGSRADLQVHADDRQARLRYAATHRHEFMWPWEDEPRSIARGILDDETYDWLAVVKGMLQTGGSPVVVDEAELAEAYSVARTATSIDADHTGTAGLAGLIKLRRDGAVGPLEQVAVVFSGAERR